MLFNLVIEVVKNKNVDSTEYLSVFSLDTLISLSLNFFLLKNQSVFEGSSDCTKLTKNGRRA